MKKQFLSCGEIINTHGVTGTVKVRSDCDSPEILASLPRIYTDGDGKNKYDIRSASVHNGFVLLTLDGVDDMDSAIALKGTEIFADRSELEKYLQDGDRFIADMIGLKIIHADTGAELGILTDVINRGASDIYVIMTPDGERMMPAVPEFVEKITDDGIFVLPIEGMLD